MKTPITYYGGKQRLADRIADMIPEHRIYCEPFFGGGAVFFAKPKSYLEAINDTNDNLINFWRVCRDNFELLQDMIQNTLHSEAEHRRAKDIYYGRTQVSEIERACAFWIATNFSQSATVYGGWKWDKGASGSHSGIVARHKRERFVSEIRDRLKDVQIFSRDALKIIANMDSPETVFYLDPPYFNANMKHYSGYSEEDMECLLDMLARLKGKFILSNYNSGLLDRYITANGWYKQQIDIYCSIPHTVSVNRRKTEVLVTNFKSTSYDKEAAMQGR